MRFLCEYRIVRQPHDLGSFDLRIPVGAFHQSYHEFALGFAAQCNQPFRHTRRTFLVGLQYEAEALPAGKVLVTGKRLKNVEGDVQAICFLGIARLKDSGGAKGRTSIEKGSKLAKADPEVARAVVLAYLGEAVCVLLAGIGIAPQSTRASAW